MTEPNAILAISSLDRFTNNKVILISTIGGAQVPIRQPVLLDTALYQLYRAGFPGGVGNNVGNDFVIESTNAILYGYIKSIGISQVQVDYKIPTVIPGKNSVVLMIFRKDDVDDLRVINIPYGFYTPDELAAMLTVLIRNEGDDDGPFFPDFEVTYAPSGILNADPAIGGGGNGFLFDSNWEGNDRSFAFAEIPPDAYGNPNPALRRELVTRWLATARLLGLNMNVFANFPGETRKQILTKSPNFIYTPYIDICSAQLTKYQKVKDSDTSPVKRGNIVARVYLSAIGTPQATTGTDALGSHPFIMTVDLNTAKTIRWDRDEAIYSLDFQLYDIYGDPLFWSPDYPTEFQMTLMCSEGQG